MKKYISIIFILSFNSLFAQTITNSYYEQDISSNFRNVYFVSNSIGYAVTYGGEILKTTDGAISWNDCNVTNDLPLFSIFFVNENLGFAVGGSSSCSSVPCSVPGGIILKTINGGESWTSEIIDDTEFNDVYFINQDTGFVAGLGNLYKTVNSGAKWESIELSEFCNAKEIKFVNDSVGFVSGLQGKLFKTTDCGETWALVNTGITSHIYSFDFWNQNIGYAGGQSDFIKTTDGGETWSVLPNVALEVYSVNCLSPDILFVGGRGQYSGGDFGHNYGKIGYSFDGGENWVLNDTIHELYSIVYLNFPSPDFGYGVSMNNTIVKISIEDYVIDGTKINSLLKSTIDAYEKNGIVYFNVPNDKLDYTLVVTDMQGKIVNTEAKTNGTFISNNLPKGVYVVNLSNATNKYECKIIKK